MSGREDESGEDEGEREREGDMVGSAVVRRFFFGVLGASLLAAACAPVAPRTVSLRIKGNVRDASVTVDDQYIGALAFVASRGVALPPGTHRITVEKTGYFPWDRVVEASEQPVYLDVVLTKIPD